MESVHVKECLSAVAVALNNRYYRICLNESVINRVDVIRVVVLLLTDNYLV